MPFDDTVFLRRNVDVLSFFTEEQLRKVTPNIEHQSYKAGQTVMFQGELTNTFYILKRGRASVFAKGAGGPVGELKSGDFFGELSLLESVSANATIKAAEDNTEILSLTHEDFQQLLRMNPQLEMLLRSRIEARRQQRASTGGH